MAAKAAKVLGLQIAGVDIMCSNKGSLALEVNSSPGPEGIEQSTGIDIAAMMISAVKDNWDGKGIWDLVRNDGSMGLESAGVRYETRTLGC